MVAHLQLSAPPPVNSGSLIIFGKLLNGDLEIRGGSAPNWFTSLSASPPPAAKAVEIADLFIILGGFASSGRKKADVNIFSAYILG